MDKMQLDRELLEKYVSDGLTQTEIACRLYVKSADRERIHENTRSKSQSR